MYLQNNKELLPLIQSVGCLYLSILKMVELITGLTISIDDVNAIWAVAYNTDVLDWTYIGIASLTLNSDTYTFFNLPFSYNLIKNKSNAVVNLRIVIEQRGTGYTYSGYSVDGNAQVVYAGAGEVTRRLSTANHMIGLRARCGKTLDDYCRVSAYYVC